MKKTREELFSGLTAMVDGEKIDLGGEMPQVIISNNDFSPLTVDATGAMTVGFPTSISIPVSTSENVFPKLNSEVVVTGQDGQVTRISQFDAVKGIIDGSLRWDGRSNVFVSTNASCESENEMNESTEKNKRILEHKDEAAEIERILKLKKYKTKKVFHLNGPVTLTIYQTIFDDGTGSRIDTINEKFIGGESFELTAVHVTTNANPRKFFQFKIETRRKGNWFVELSEDDCFSYFNNFNWIFETVEHERMLAQQKMERRLEQERKKAEEVELQKIVNQAQREEGGYGTWS